MPLITLEEAKAQARIDHSDEDALPTGDDCAYRRYVARRYKAHDLETTPPYAGETAALLVFADPVRLTARPKPTAHCPLTRPPVGAGDVPGLQGVCAMGRAERTSTIRRGGSKDTFGQPLPNDWVDVASGPTSRHLNWIGLKYGLGPLHPSRECIHPNPSPKGCDCRHASGVCRQELRS